MDDAQDQTATPSGWQCKGPDLAQPQAERSRVGHPLVRLAIQDLKCDVLVLDALTPAAREMTQSAPLSSRRHWQQLENPPCDVQLLGHSSSGIRHSYQLEISRTSGRHSSASQLAHPGAERLHLDDPHVCLATNDVEHDSFGGVFYEHWSI